MRFSPSLIIAAFLLLESANIAFLHHNWRDKQEQYFAQQAISLETAYRSSVNMYALATEFVFNQVVNQPDVIDAFRAGINATEEEGKGAARGRLYRLLYPTYSKLKASNLRQFHFHLANGESFLRFHDPAKFGDSLFDIRPSIRLANTLKRPVLGFETGRVLSGFRYVYPIILNGEHLGSMEASVSFRAIRDAMAEIEHSREYAFLLRRDAVVSKLAEDQLSLYGEADLHTSYLVEDPNLKLPDSPPPPSKTVLALNAQLRGLPEVIEGMNAGRTMTVTAELNDKTWAATFLPVRNVEDRQVAYVVAYTEAPFAQTLWRDYLLWLGISSLSLLLVGLLVWRILRYQSELESEKQNLQAVTDTVADGLYAMDETGHLTMVNPAAETLLGFRESDVLGKIGHDIFHSHAVNNNLPKEQCPIYQRVTCAEPFDGEEIFARADGGTLQVEVASRAVLERDRVTGSVTVFRDITQRKKAEAALNEAKAAAETANRMKSEFLANMSHEIRTPMNGIIGLTQVALDGELEPGQRENLEMVSQSAHLLMTIINDILDFSKIEAGHLTVEKIPFRLQRTLDSAIQPLALRAAEKGLALRVEIDSCTPNSLLGDPVRLSQVVTNLIGNAIKFTQQGHILLKVRCLPDATDKLLEFCISDTGAGIPEDKLDSIFEAFSQVDASITRRFGGTGLGLAIVRNLVTLMGGTVSVESTLGVGSTFRFTLHCEAVAESEPQPHNGPVSINKPIGPLHLLLVEDNAVNRRLAVTLLGKAGHRVSVAEDGAEALALLLAKHDFDAVLMDVQMPVMDGVEVTRAVRAHEAIHHGHLPIIAMTANAMAGDRERFLATGMDDYVAKPISVGELFAALNRVMSND